MGAERSEASKARQWLRRRPELAGGVAESCDQSAAAEASEELHARRALLARVQPRVRGRRADPLHSQAVPASAKAKSP